MLFRLVNLQIPNGREVGISNTIFMTTSTLTNDKASSCSNELCTYSEEKILRVREWPVKILVEQALGGEVGETAAPFSPREGVSGSIFLNKRKLVGANQNPGRQEITEVVKRAHKTSARHLDLNLPAEENDLLDTDNDHGSDNSLQLGDLLKF
ncbi:hypothetical protein OIU78_006515 [Salix suchowensis]|nr:hypothetical protein OIU78_006515 [Salix suchowensis]